MKKIVTVLFLIATALSGSTMYTLSGIKKVYPLVEVSGKEIPKSFKEMAKEEINSVLDEIGIDHEGYDPRALALLINTAHIENTLLITMKLVIGEQVLRVDTKTKTFAITYESVEKLQLKDISEIEDELEDALSVLLDRFSEQYLEEKKKIVKIDLQNDDFSKIGYETNYDKAVEKAQKLKKPILLVLVANYCPWCRKFEQDVLRKKDVNDLIQSDYIPVIINREEGGFPKKFDMAFTPIVHFIDSKTLESKKVVAGYNNKDEFTYTLKKFHTTK